MAPPQDQTRVSSTEPGTPLPRVSLVVFDLDDTLYDWIGHFMPALEAMIHTAARILNVSAATVRDELREVHRHYGNTEQPFALLETRTCQATFGHLDREQQKHALAPAFAAFDQVRAHRLKLFDDVEPVFQRLRADDIPFVGYTAATSVNIAKRLKLLGLDQYFDTIYATTYTGLPYPGRKVDERPRASAGETPRVSIVEIPTPKPDPAAIYRICADHSLPPAETLFVGDSTSHDVAPALQAGAQAALIVRTSTSQEAWLPKLLEITHRTTERTPPSASASSRRPSHQAPQISSLLELWDHFTFTPRTTS